MLQIFTGSDPIASWWTAIVVLVIVTVVVYLLLARIIIPETAGEGVFDFGEGEARGVEVLGVGV